MDDIKGVVRHRVRPSHRSPTGRRSLAAGFVLLLLSSGAVLVGSASAQSLPLEVQSLDGSGNNLANPQWGRAGNPYSRVAPTRYADGIGELWPAPDSRYVSNRIFNDVHQNLFSQRGVTQWGFAWGQFLDHTFGLRAAPGVGDSPDPSSRNIPFDPDDPLEEFDNDLGDIPFTRSLASPGTGITTPREQDNTVSSYIDGWAVYGGSDERLEWMREGPVDGDLSNNSAMLLLPDGFLPRRDARGDPGDAPPMDVDGFLRGTPDRAVVAGDVRANENLGLQATQNLFAAEHNRLVSELPDSLTEEKKFQIARRLVIAQQQYITYHEFLPALGVRLPAYQGYDPSVNTDLSNEFATVGYRAHSMVHGEIELETELDRYSPAQLAELAEMGVEVEIEGDEVELAIPLALAFFNPDLLELVGLGPLLQGLGLEAQYRNDEQIDNQLRSVLFQVPVPGNVECLDGPDLPECFDGVIDLGAIDVERGYDHGMPSYNELREAYGLAPKASFTAITGEDTDEFPPGLGIDDPAILDFVALFDRDGNPIELDSEEAEGEAVVGVRRTTLAARLRGVFGSVDDLDAFTGMVSEQHVPGTDFGELQLAIWTREFQHLRDGDRFFYGNDPGLWALQETYGLDFRRTLAEVIADNTDITADDLHHNVFLVADEEPTTCAVDFVVNGQWNGGFQVRLDVTNTGSTPINGWELEFAFPTGQQLSTGWNARFSQSGDQVSMSVPSGNWQGDLAPGDTATGWFNASWDNATNAGPTHFTLNEQRCTT